jgi:hypothetical protein
VTPCPHRCPSVGRLATVALRLVSTIRIKSGSVRRLSQYAPQLLLAYLIFDTLLILCGDWRGRPRHHNIMVGSVTILARLGTKKRQP